MSDQVSTNSREIDMQAHLQYMKYVLRHKWFVLLEGLKIGPGRWYRWLYWAWILIWHDWDKFMPDEWFAYT